MYKIDTFNRFCIIEILIIRVAELMGNVNATCSNLYKFGIYSTKYILLLVINNNNYY